MEEEKKERNPYAAYKTRYLLSDPLYMKFVKVCLNFLRIRTVCSMNNVCQSLIE